MGADFCQWIRCRWGLFTSVSTYMVYCAPLIHRTTAYDDAINSNTDNAVLCLPCPSRPQVVTARVTQSSLNSELTLRPLQSPRYSSQSVDATKAWSVCHAEPLKGNIA